MDELQLLRELTDDVPRPSADRLAPARARLRAEIAQETAPSPVRRRMVWAAAVAVGVAAASVAVVGITGTTDSAPAPPAEVAAGPEQVLRAAAVAARAHPVAAPSDDQFIYTKMVRQGGITTET
ncbi:hypothetical protein [Amycolatopsis magusensis]|uniref:hypothetical protein n=1 Tax=Amycolatopsis magusensis TaxID=882444 RepID=UPI0024A8713C|nr:hypothetical protein [Amycolatopsis magusensis]MDI5976784.1 hypothetical protein [Amycolatopsis magusensis]